MEVDSLVRALIVILIACGTFLGWLLLLAGESALQNICSGSFTGCRQLTGLTWAIIWFQLLVYLASLPLQFGRLAFVKTPLLFVLGILAALEMIQADRLLDLKDGRPLSPPGAAHSLRHFGHGSRINATVAGHATLAGFNVLTILFLGFIQYDSYATPEQDEGKEHHRQYPTPPSMPGGHPMKPMTSRASSMRAGSSPTPSEISYPGPHRR